MALLAHQGDSLPLVAVAAELILLLQYLALVMRSRQNRDHHCLLQPQRHDLVTSRVTRSNTAEKEKTVHSKPSMALSRVGSGVYVRCGNRRVVTLFFVVVQVETGDRVSIWRAGSNVVMFCKGPWMGAIVFVLSLTSCFSSSWEYLSYD